MGIRPRIAQQPFQSCHGVVVQRVFHHLGVTVDVIWWQVQTAGQIELPNAVLADDALGFSKTCGRQSEALAVRFN